MRSLNWSNTSLGSVATWSPSLKTAFSFLLAANQPMFLVWGRDRSIFYNDSYALLLQDSNRFLPLGTPVQACEWLDSAAIEQVLTTGKPLQGDADRFAYSAIWDEGGNISGILALGNETTISLDCNSEENAIAFARTALHRTEVALQDLEHAISHYLTRLMKAFVSSN